MIFEFIKENRRLFEILEMCETLDVSTNGFYRWEKAEPSVRDQEDDSLKKRILEIHDQASGDYGHRPIHDHLMEERYLCGRDRTLRLMNELEISDQQSKAYKPQGTDSTHDFGYSPNLLKKLGETRFCDEAWVADTTYLLTDSGWMYLATVMDRHSRRIFGWSVSPSNDTALILEALKAAVMTRGTSVAGNCYDNAAMESFYGRFKTGSVRNRIFSDEIDLRRHVFDYIEVFYNRFRKHSSLGYKTPIQFEREFFAPQGGQREERYLYQSQKN